MKKKIKDSLFYRKNLEDALKNSKDSNRDRIRKNSKGFLNKLKPDWLLTPGEYLEEMLKGGWCATMNECQCIGIGKGGCPGEPTWTPENIFKSKEVENDDCE